MNVHMLDVDKEEGVSGATGEREWIIEKDDR